MGFNLRMFFEEIQHLLDTEGISPEQKLEIVKALVDFNKQYAEQCGQLN